MSEGYYVLLTGARDNAGDHLIRKRAVELLRKERPDRDIVERDRATPLEGELLELVNGAKALLLTGGPGLRFDMYPGVYALASRLEDIKAEILSFGIGWKSPAWGWAAEARYRLSRATRRLLSRIEEGGRASSVRDYASLRVLASRGYSNFVMTGCPAYYAPPTVESKPSGSPSLVFSASVSFMDSPAMADGQRRLVAELVRRFGSGELVVAFHHGLDPEKAARNFGQPRAERYLEFASWCAGLGLRVADLSGGPEAMERLYGEAGLHVGYRVHAHILRTSLGLPSLLVAEDGRGFAVGEVLGGTVLPGFGRYTGDMVRRVLRKAFGVAADPYSLDEDFPRRVMEAFDRERELGFPGLRAARERISANAGTMRAFLRALP